MTEGVIKFNLDWVPSNGPGESIDELNVWREILFRLRLVGQDVKRYDGLGYGNLSQRSRVDPSHILITASQTGNVEHLQDSHYCRVEAVDIARNRVRGRGPSKPSSEVLTHAMLYQLDASINAVFHIHDPKLWSYGLQRGYPSVPSEIEYGSVEMARDVERLYQEGNLRDAGILTMRGHLDGVVVFGETLEHTGAQLINFWIEASTA